MDTIQNLLIGQTVFISYAREDEAVAKKIASMLEKASVRHFLDLKNIGWGDTISSRVQDGLADASVLIVVISRASLKSAWVPFEVGNAMGTGKVILPYVTSPRIKRPSYLSGFLYASSLKQISDFFLLPAELNSASQLKTPAFGPYTGQYAALTWQPDKRSVLVEKVLCRQIGGKLAGMISGMVYFNWDVSKQKHVERAENHAQYTFAGFLDQRVFVVSYRSTGPTHYSSGVIALKADSTGACFSGNWSGVYDDKIGTSKCVWLKLPPTIDFFNNRVQVMKMVGEHLAFDSKGPYFGSGKQGFVKWAENRNEPLPELQKVAGYFDRPSTAETKNATHRQRSKRKSK